MKHGRLEEEPYLYRGRGLLEVVGPMGRGVAGSGWFRVGEQVFEGGGIREVCPVTVGLLCTGRLSRLFLRMCNRGFQDLLSVRPSSLFMLNGCISSSPPYFTPHNQPLKMEQIKCSETSAFNNQKPGKYPKDYTQYSKHGESLKSRNSK